MKSHITASVVRPLISEDRESITLQIEGQDASALSVSFNRDLLYRVMAGLVWLDAAPASPGRDAARQDRKS